MLAFSETFIYNSMFLSSPEEAMRRAREKHTPNNGGRGFQKMQGKKSKITIALPLHKLWTIPYESGHKKNFDCILIGSLAIWGIQCMLLLLLYVIMVIIIIIIIIIIILLLQVRPENNIIIIS